VTPRTRRSTVVIRTGLSSSLVVVRHTNETRKPLRSATSAVGPDGPMSPAEIRRRHLLVILLPVDSRPEACFRPQSARAPRRSARHPQGRNAVEEPRLRGLTRWPPWWLRGRRADAYPLVGNHASNLSEGPGPTHTCFRRALCAARFTGLASGVSRE